MTTPFRIPIDADCSAHDALRTLADDPMPFGLIGRWARGGAILGSRPARVVTGSDALDVPALTTREPEAPESMPEGFVGGGWVGYFGYGLGAVFESLPPPPPRPAPLPLACLAYYDHVLRLDPDGQWWFEAIRAEAVSRRFEELRRRLTAPAACRPWRLGPLGAKGAGPAGHRAAVADCVERIAAGELFQANLCLRLEGRFDGSAVDAFADAAARLRPAYGAFIGLDDGALVSFSPELFLRRRGRDVETAPIKGTAQRFEDESRSSAARRALVSSAKDAAEHVMIVDLMRNDLGRVAVYGSVEAAVRPDVEAHPGLWHLVTRVRARLRADVTDRDLLRATLPPGSVTGAPKIQAMKVISALEGTGREAYTGAIGIISPVSGLELSVAIRTLEVRGGVAWLGCGGGIVADSDPGRELREAFDKARPIAGALGTTIMEGDDRTRPLRQRTTLGLGRRPDPGIGLLETILVRDGRAVGLDRHLRRLDDSAREVLGVELPSTVRREVVLAVARAGSGDARLRVVLGRRGTAEVMISPVGPLPATIEVTPIVVSGGLGPHKLADRAPLAPFDSVGRAALICDLDWSVLEASSANVWAMLGDRLITPPADGRILPGLVRERLLELARLDPFVLREAPLALLQLEQAEGLILTSSIRGAVAGHLPDGRIDERATRLASRLRQALIGTSRSPRMAVPAALPE